MDTAEFNKFWNLLRELFPASPKTRNKNTRAVWKRALEPYALDAVTETAVDCARRSKFFPDIADVTASLPARAPRGKERENLSWMLVYIQREAAQESAEHAEQYHAAGVQTWPEARKSDVKWQDWIADCRRAFSTGRGHTRIFPDE